MRLSVNIDHVATLRQARQITYPDPIEAARIALANGADGITIHLRGDRRHIQDRDVERLMAEVETRVNLEIATTDEMLRLVERLRPHQVTLVPERPEEVTTEGGLDLLAHPDEIHRACQRVQTAGCSVSLFIDPDPRQLEALERFEKDTVVGFEINTDAYARASDSERETRLAAIRDTATSGHRLGFSVYAGHALTTANVGAVAAVQEVEELNIGHWLISRAVLIGLGPAVEEMIQAIGTGRSESLGPPQL